MTDKTDEQVVSKMNELFEAVERLCSEAMNMDHGADYSELKDMEARLFVTQREVRFLLPAARAEWERAKPKDVPEFPKLLAGAVSATVKENRKIESRPSDDLYLVHKLIEKVTFGIDDKGPYLAWREWLDECERAGCNANDMMNKIKKGTSDGGRD